MDNLQRISIKETRDNLSQFIDQVAVAKKRFLITKFGKPKAKLVPVDNSLYKTQKKGLHESYGAWKGKKGIKDSARWVEDLRAKMSSRYGKISG